MSKIINVFQTYHLGDNIINFIFFRKIKEYIEANDIIIHYRCHDQYHQNLNDFNCSKNIVILPYEMIGYHLWQGTIPYEKYIENQLCKMFNIFLKKNNIPIIVDAFEYEDINLLERFEMLENKYKNIDILVINSSPKSGQFNYNKNDWDYFLLNLSKKYTIATTEKVDDSIISLADMSVKNIAAIATNVKKIIAINTGPSVPLYNTNILNNVDVIYMFDKCCYNFKTRKILHKRNIKELSFLLDE